MDRVRVYIGLGSNLGDREASLRLAVRSIAELASVRIEGISRVYESDAVGPGVQGAYLNAAVEATCERTAEALLEALFAIEARAGRVRTQEVERWAARTLDLDLLFFGNVCVEQPGLVLPHPRLHERAFVLEPLRDLAPEFVHPRKGRSIAKLADDLADRSTVRIWSARLEQ